MLPAIALAMVSGITRQLSAFFCVPCIADKSGGESTILGHVVANH